MNRLISRMALLLSISIISTSCDKSDDTVDPAANLEQTCWKGTWSINDTSHEIYLFFETATSGLCVVDNQRAGIHYSHDKNIIRVSSNVEQISTIDGAWWIDYRTLTQLRLLAYPMIDNNIDNIITLQRIYQ